MTTILKKPVRRRTSDEITYRDRSKHRPFVVTIYPSGYIGIRLHKTRREETITIEGAYEKAVQSRVARQRMEKINAKKNGTFKVRRGRRL